GDTIEQDEPVLEVATDKVDTEIPATHAGILKEILAPEGEVVEIGKPIAIIATDEDSTPNIPSNDHHNNNTHDTQVLSSLEEGVSQAIGNSRNGFEQLEKPMQDRFYSPLVLNIAKEENISMDELAYIPGSGMDNRVTKRDILNYLAHKKEETLAPASSQKSVQVKEPEPAVKTTPEPGSEPIKVSTEVFVTGSTSGGSLSGQMEIIEMDRMRKMIAQRMVDSKRISPHVTTFVEVDVTNIVQWRERIKESFKRREGQNITYTPIFIEAIAKTLKDFPMVNISVEGDKILVKKDINIGMATALPSGNLIVPVIHQADYMSLLGLTKKVNDLAQRARNNQLKPDELAGGTYTMSNIGSFGNEMGTPIILQPQVAILAFGTIKKKPAVIETPQGDLIGIRHMMFISHAYDHRVVDGALGGSFARRVADYLEAFDPERDM
ncbi:MAG: 2-oxo acid dehydrogenase subunit E2, partial [Bacteroidia bacterium]|nr:2-oxo acid dehydrogenase subunit E2 [Bacteroidia bacterium]